MALWAWRSGDNALIVIRTTVPAWRPWWEAVCRLAPEKYHWPTMAFFF